MNGGEQNKFPRQEVDFLRALREQFGITFDDPQPRGRKGHRGVSQGVKVAGERLAEAMMENQGMTDKELASASGVNRRVIYNLRTGRKKTSMANCKKLVAILPRLADGEE